MSETSYDWSGFEDVSVVPSSSTIASRLVHATATWHARTPAQNVSVLICPHTEEHLIASLRDCDEALRRLALSTPRMEIRLTHYDVDGNLWSIRAREDDQELEAIYLEPRRRPGKALKPFSNFLAESFSVHAIQIAHICAKLEKEGVTPRSLRLHAFLARKGDAQHTRRFGEMVLQNLVAAETGEEPLDWVQACGSLLCELVTGSRAFDAAAISRAFKQAEDFADLVDLDLDVDWPRLLGKAMSMGKERYVSVISLSMDLLAMRNPERFEHWQIGELDDMSRFKIDRPACWGRNAIIQQILGVINQPEDMLPGNGFRQVALKGDAGSGKSAILRELERRLPGVPVFKYKFDPQATQSDNDIGAQSISFMLQHLKKQPPALQDEFRRQMRRKLAKAVLDVAQQWIGPEAAEGFFDPPETTETPVITPDRSLEIVRLGLYELGNIFTSLVRPFVVFIDDLQWLPEHDAWLIHMAKDYDTCNITTVIASRVEPEATPGARLLINELESCVLTLQVNPLDLPSIVQWVGDVLYDASKAADRADDELVGRLAQHLYLKASGNAFLTEQSLRFLYDSGALSFAWSVERWTVDPAQLRELEPMDTLSKRLSTVEPQLGYMLKTMRCLAAGGTFSYADLLIASDLPNADARRLVQKALDNFVAEVTPANGGDFTLLRFQHDLIYQTISEWDTEWKNFHLAAALRLLAHIPSPELARKRARLVTLITIRALDLGARLANDEDALSLAKVARRASHDAMNQASFNMALNFCRTAFRISKDRKELDIWQADIRFATRLSDLYCCLLITLNQPKEAVQQAELFYKRADNATSSMMAAKWLIRGLAQSQPEQAFERAQGHLQAYEIDLSFYTGEMPTLPTAQEQGGWPEETDTLHIALVEFLHETLWVSVALSNGYFCGAVRAISSYVVSRKRKSLAGQCLLMDAISAGPVVTSKPDLELMRTWDEWGRDMAQSSPKLKIHCDGLAMHMCPWGDRGLDACAVQLDESAKHAVSLCLYREADYILRWSLVSALFGSKSLDFIIDRRSLASQIATWQPIGRGGLEALSQFAATLYGDPAQTPSEGGMELAEPCSVSDNFESLCSLEGAIHQETDSMRKAEFTWGQLQALRLVMSLVLDCPGPARRALLEYRAYRHKVWPLLLRTIYPFLESIVLIEQIADDDGNVADHRRRIQENIEDLTELGDCAKDAYDVMGDLVRAYYASTTQTDEQHVVDMFQRAVERADENEFSLIRGLGHERFAGYARLIGRSELADAQAEEAQTAWQTWGAHVKSVRRGDEM